jgi:UDP-N-acetylmuramate dehydrogenase
MNNEVDEKLKNILGEKLILNEPLKNHVSLKVGGVADYFYRAETVNELLSAVKTAHNLEVSFFILGGGYNIVPSDGGFPGLVILNKTSNIVFPPGSSSVIVDSGVNLGRLINLAAGRDLGGFEFLAGVPGTVGGAIYGNAGAFEHSIGEFVKTVTVLIEKEGFLHVEKYSGDQLQFAYRSSMFKRWLEGESKPVILTATLQLVQRRKDEILNLIYDFAATKRKTQPLEEISAGSFFKNPGLGKERAAGFLLDRAGAKQLKIGGAAVSKKHANFLVNRKNATASEIRELATKLKELIRARDDLILEEEIEYIGRW